MRSILSISLPAEKKAEIEKRAKKAGKTVSSYVMDIIDFEMNMISEDELVEMVKQSEAAYAAGKTKVLSSLSELMTKNANKKNSLL
jgi:predicted DNA-binding protein